jgi:hypothetical protein
MAVGKPSTGLCFACAVSLVLITLGMVSLHAGYEPREAIRFRFDIDHPTTSLSELLPPAPRLADSSRIAVVDDLAQVPEVALQEFLALPRLAKASDKDKADLAKIEARKPIAHQIAKINFLNRKSTDHFVEVLSANRPDLAGLPFVLGESARLSRWRRKGLGDAVLAVRRALGTDPEKFREHAHVSADRFGAAALTQILATEMPLKDERGVSDGFRHGLVQRLAKNSTDEATRGLARIAIFSVEDELRRDALDVLQKRSTSAATKILREGLRYPWPTVVRNTAEAVVELGRVDLGLDLAGMLEAADPRMPVRQDVGGEQVYAVRELVRINHHRNCLLCHPPGNTPDVVRAGRVDESNMFANRDVAALTAEVPAAGEELARRDSGYDPFATEFPDVLVRADITYLRPDFSRLQEVAEAHPWPAMQRFDYLVRKRVLTAAEAQAYQSELAARSDTSHHRQVALSALRRLTGIDAGESADAWRAALWSAWGRRTVRQLAVGGCALCACLTMCWAGQRRRRLRALAPTLAMKTTSFRTDLQAHGTR